MLPTVLNVPGMGCGSCVRRVSAALRAMNGVTDVEVYLAEGRVSVEHDPVAAPLEALLQTLRECGYGSCTLSKTAPDPAS